MKKNMKKAKKESLMKLKKLMMGHHGDMMDKPMKVSVIAKDEEGLEEGLEKAKEMMEEREETEKSQEGGHMCSKCMREMEE